MLWRHRPVTLALLTLSLSLSWMLWRPAPVQAQTPLILTLPALPAMLNPIVDNSDEARAIHQFIFESLLDPNDYGPRLAQRYEIDETQRTITYHLRSQLTWSDGKVLRAGEIKASLEHFLKFGNRGLNTLIPLVKHIQTPDDQTVVIELTQNNHTLFEFFSLTPIVPQNELDSGATTKKLIKGSGPFVVADFKDKTIILTRNKLWWGNTDASLGASYDYQYIQFINCQQKSQCLKLVAQNEIDYLDLTPAEFYEFKNIIQENKITYAQIKSQRDRGFSFIVFNLDNPILQDRNVRQALNKLFPRQQYNQQYLQNSFIPIDNPFFTIPTKINQYDPKAAKRLLSTAGWKDLNGDGILDKKIQQQLMPLKITILGNELASPIYQEFTAEAKRAGVIIDWQTISQEKLLQQVFGHTFEAAIFSWNSAFQDPQLELLWHSRSYQQGYNFGHYQNREVDQLIERYLQLYNVAERKKILNSLAQKIAVDAPYLFLFAPQDSYSLFSKRLKLGDMKTPTHHMRHWKLLN